MSMSKQYNLADTLNNKVNEAALLSQIRSSSSVLVAADRVDGDPGASTFTVYMRDTLVDWTAVDSLVAAHPGESIDVIQKVEDVLTESTFDTRHKGTGGQGENGSAFEKILHMGGSEVITYIYIALDNDMNRLYGGDIQFYDHKAGYDWFSSATVAKIDSDPANDIVIAQNFRGIPVRKDGHHEFRSQFLSKEVPAGLYCRLEVHTFGSVDCGLTWAVFARKKPS